MRTCAKQKDLPRDIWWPHDSHLSLKTCCPRASPLIPLAVGWSAPPCDSAVNVRGMHALLNQNLASTQVLSEAHAQSSWSVR
ncbi:MAG: hypothetical protein ACK55Z_02895, partial [bacterium]